MYRTDIHPIRDFGHTSPLHLAAMITMALLSIRQPFRTVERQMQHVRLNGENSGYLWGFKRAGYNYALDNALDIHSNIVGCTSPEAAIEALIEVPGLGLAKAGFVAQMLGFDVGCIDSRNASRLGLRRKHSRIDKWRPEHVRLNAISKYVAMCQRLGGAERLWDDWCEDISRDEFFLTPDRVSRYHLDCLKAGI